MARKPTMQRTRTSAKAKKLNEGKTSSKQKTRTTAKAHQAKPSKATRAAAKRPTTSTAKRASARQTNARGAAALVLEAHPGFVEITRRLRPGSYAGGLVVITEPGALDTELSAWLMGNMEGRRSLGRTAFGELLVFRDLRERARQFGGDPEREADVALVDIHFKKMTSFGTSVETFLDGLDDPQFLDAFFRRELFTQAVKRLGPCAKNECYGFVPMLAFGGSEDVESLQRLDWRVHQAILLQT